MQHNTITESEKTARKKAFEFAIDNNRLEGLEPSQIVLDLSQKWVNGEISYSELETKVYEIHGI
ncbi:antitoxin VbhA family protein [Testudinibacter sp. P27/CKL/0425]